MIHAHGIHGQLMKALQLFKEMTAVKMTPDENTYSHILKILAEMTNLCEGQQIHEQLKV
jgi:pentatricopeptide repeat protein